MSPQQRTDAKWNAGIIVTVLLAAFGLSTQIGRYQEKVDRLLEDMREGRHQQTATDSEQNGRLGVIENRTTALETDVAAMKSSRDDRKRQARPFGGISVQ